MTAKMILWLGGIAVGYLGFATYFTRKKSPLSIPYKQGMNFFWMNFDNYVGIYRDENRDWIYNRFQLGSNNIANLFTNCDFGDNVKFQTSDDIKIGDITHNIESGGFEYNIFKRITKLKLVGGKEGKQIFPVNKND